MSSVSNVASAFGLLGIAKEILEILFFISVIILSFKVVMEDIYLEN